MKTKNVLELSWDEWLMNAEVEDMEDSIEKVAELLRERKEDLICHISRRKWSNRLGRLTS